MMFLVIAEYLIFVLTAIGAFILSHVGLLLLERLDIFLSTGNRLRSRSSRLGGARHGGRRDVASGF